MSFFSKLFRRKKLHNEASEDWENIVFSRDTVHFQIQEERTRYVSGCLEQIADATKEENLLSGEYSIVTSRLTDMEEIDLLPEREKERVISIAKQLMYLEQECKKYQDKKSGMSEKDYQHMREQEGEIQEGLSKLIECEKYAGLVKQDLQRLDRERHAYQYRRVELENMMNNFRGMTVIFLSAFGMCMILLLVLHFGFEMDARVGIFLASGLVAVAVSVMAVKYMDRERELRKIETAINKLIQLQNKVKIRYVNNNNLLEYLRIKYNTESASALQKKWQQYQKEKEARKEFAEAEAKKEHYQEELINQLSQYHILDPVRWIHQPGALVDKREMVEIRHELILRRQALRKQMDYNQKVAQTARNEIMDVVKQYPEYGQEILDMVDKYEILTID